MASIAGEMLSQPKRLLASDVPVILGSSSRWRRKLFADNFPEYSNTEMLNPDIDEKAIRADVPEEMVLAIANAKADALLPSIVDRDVLLVTMDQVVCCDGEVREKPETKAEAGAFLRSYSEGKGARCVNGMIVHCNRTGKRIRCVETATAFWRTFGPSVIDALVEDGAIFTCAGGFTVEHPELSPFLDRTEGRDGMHAIQGLPVKRLREMLRLATALPVTHVLFDMDGLLLDTESAYTVAQHEIIGRWGKSFTWELKAKMMGRKATDAAQILIDELALQDEITAEEFVQEREIILDKLFADSTLLPGVERLVNHLHAHGVPMAVATSSHRRHFDLKTNRHRALFDLMHHVVTGDQVAVSKPNPEIFLLAASQFDTTKSQSCEDEGSASFPVSDASCVLVFEDAPNGVEAGIAAGMQVCHVPDTNLGLEFRGGSHCELKSLLDLDPTQFGLPQF